VEYDSQGQARSEASRVGPGKSPKQGDEPWKGRNTTTIISAFQALSRLFNYLTRADALRAWPWLLYFAPSALRTMHPI